MVTSLLLGIFSPQVRLIASRRHIITGSLIFEASKDAAVFVQ